jgi:hypothetical protein
MIRKFTTRPLRRRANVGLAALTALALAGCTHAPPPVQGPRGFIGGHATDAQACFGTPAKTEATPTGETWTYYRSGTSVDVGSATSADESSCVITVELTQGRVTSLSTRPVGANADPLVCADLAAACAH